MKVTYNPETKTLTVPKVRGVIYQIDGKPVTGEVVISEDTIVEAVPEEGVKFAENAETSKVFEVGEDAPEESVLQNSGEIDKPSDDPVEDLDSDLIV